VSSSENQTAGSSLVEASGSGQAQGDVSDPSLAKAGRQRIDWARATMPVLEKIRRRFEQDKPLAGLRIAACLHITTETANLLETLKAGGAEVWACASNPLSTQDDVAASLTYDSGIPTFARRGEDSSVYYSHIDAVLDRQPDVTMDDGCDLVTRLHKERPDQVASVLGGTEETTTGVIRLRAMEKDGALGYPIVAVNDADTKHLFDNRYGTGQSSIDGILRATNMLLAGKVFVVAGYGWCGRGIASRARGMGAQVIVCEVDPLKALEAVMDGFRVMPMGEAAREGEVFVTATGDCEVLRADHFAAMRDGAVLANAGHFDVELDLEALDRLSEGRHREVRPMVEEYEIGVGSEVRRIYVLVQGRLVNLGAAEGHPAAVMDMSFADQALAVEWLVAQRGSLKPGVHDLPRELDEEVARLKLASMRISIDTLTPRQASYLASWESGT